MITHSPKTADVTFFFAAKIVSNSGYVELRIELKSRGCDYACKIKNACRQRYLRAFWQLTDTRICKDGEDIRRASHYAVDLSRPSKIRYFCSFLKLPLCQWIIGVIRNDTSISNSICKGPPGLGMKFLTGTTDDIIPHFVKRHQLHRFLF